MYSHQFNKLLTNIKQHKIPIIDMYKREKNKEGETLRTEKKEKFGEREKVG